jgi:hypothetical protein
VVSPAIGGLLVRAGALERLGRGDLAGPQLGEHPGHVLLDLVDAGVVVELTGDPLEAQVEQLLFGLRQALEQLGVADLGERVVLRHQKTS